MKDASLVMLRDASMGPIFGHFQRPRARHCHLQCFNIQLDPTSVRGSSQHFSSSSLLLVSVDGALTESVNCSDVWNVRYSSAHYTIESRRSTRTLIRQNSLLAVRRELTVSHNASALAQESAIPNWKDLAPLRLPCPWTDEPMATCAVQGVWRGTNEATIPAGGSFEC